MSFRVCVSCVTVTCASLVHVSGCINDSDKAPVGPGLIDASLPDSSLVEAGPIEAGPTEAGPDAEPTEAGPIDAGCAPGSIADFVAPPYPSVVGARDRCEDFEISSLAAACFGDASSFTACQGYRTTGADGGPVQEQCVECLFHDIDGGSMGVVLPGVVPTVNLAGCIETWGSLACATAVHDAWRCAEHACQKTCPVVADDATRAEFLACAAVARTTVCASLAQAAATCIAEERGDGGGTYVDMECFDGETEAEQLENVLRFFCTS